MFSTSKFAAKKVFVYNLMICSISIYFEIWNQHCDTRFDKFTFKNFKISSLRWDFKSLQEEKAIMLSKESSLFFSNLKLGDIKLTAPPPSLGK